MSHLSRRWGSTALAIALAAAAAGTAVATNAAPAPADTGAACGVSYTIGWQTPSNSPPDFGAAVTVTNNSSYPISTWTVTWSFTAGQTIVPGSPYSANVSQSGTAVTAANVSYNGSLATGANTAYGFNGSWNNSSNPAPSSFALNPPSSAGNATRVRSSASA